MQNLKDALQGPTAEINRRVAVVFGVLLFALLAVSILTAFNAERERAANREMASLSQIGDELDGLLSAHLDAETGERGFLLTGDHDFLTPYKNALQTLDSRFASLRERIQTQGDDSSRAMALASLETLRKRSNELQVTLAADIETRKRLGPSGVTPTAMLQSKSQMEAIRDRLRLLNANEDATAKRQATRVQLLHQQNTLAFAVAVFIASLLLIAAYALIRRILTLQEQNREILSVSEQRLGLAIEAVNGAVYDWNPLTGDVWRSERFQTLFGVPLNANTLRENDWKARLHPDDVEAMDAAFHRALAGGGNAYHVEYRVRLADGEYIPVLDSAIIVREGDKIARVVGNTMDVRERKKAEEEMRAHQREIEELNKRLHLVIAESHHRIKNNLQVLASLIEMMRFDSAADPYERLTRHIRALASLHDLLTLEAKSGDIHERFRVSFKHALEQLISVMETAAGDRPITVEADEVRLTLKQCSALSLLVNEAVSNAIKHGKGTIHVLLKAQGENAELQICDEGPGFPPGFSIMDSNTGIDLVESMAKWDLRGDVTYSNLPEGGACVTVTFPLDEEAAYAQEQGERWEAASEAA